MIDNIHAVAAMLLEPLALTSWALLLLNVLLWRQRAAKAARWVCGVITVVFMAAASPFFANELQGWLEDRARTEATCPAPPAGSVFVVLAGGVDGRAIDVENIARLKDQTFRRTVAGVRLAVQVPGSVLVLSGGSGGRAVREADLMQTLAVALGMPAERVIVERESRSTFDNARMVKPLLLPFGDRPIYLVTSAMHLRRAAAVFRTTGQRICPLPVDFQRQEPEWAEAVVPRVLSMLKTAESLREMVAYVVYRLQGRIATEAAMNAKDSL